MALVVVMATPLGIELVEVAKFELPEVTPIWPPERKFGGQVMETAFPFSRLVAVLNETVTDLPVAPGMRSAAAMAKDTDEIWPPSAGAAPVPGRSVDVDTVTPLAQEAVRPPRTAPVRVRLYAPGGAPLDPILMVTPGKFMKAVVAKVFP